MRQVSWNIMLFSFSLYLAAQLVHAQLKSVPQLSGVLTCPSVVMMPMPSLHPTHDSTVPLRPPAAHLPVPHKSATIMVSSSTLCCIQHRQLHMVLTTGNEAGLAPPMSAMYPSRDGHDCSPYAPTVGALLHVSKAPEILAKKNKHVMGADELTSIAANLATRLSSPNLSAERS